jgi:hypothetical protein
VTGGTAASDMEDLENARRGSAEAKGFDDKKQQVVESSETRIIVPGDTARLPVNQRIARRLEAWGVESRGAIPLFVFLNGF